MQSPLTVLATTAMLTAILAGCASKPKEIAALGARTSESVAPRFTPQVAAGATPAGLRPGSQEGLAANAGERVYFGVDQYELDDSARETPARQASWMSRHPDVRVLIAGNADERGTREYNIALGSRRAEAARAYLISRGVAASRIQTVSYDKERPLDPSSGEEAWAKNRNGHTVLMEVIGRGG